MSMIVLSVSLLLALSQTPPVASSFELLSGARLTRFKKSRGRSEAGHNIQIRVSGDRLTTKLQRWNRASVSFKDGGVCYVVRRDNPHLVQTLRKLRRQGKIRTVVLKGTVMSQRVKKGAKRSCYVWVRTFQAILAQGKRKKR